MANIKFEYLYRDEGNYKTFGEVIFSNPDSLSLNFVRNFIESHLIEGAWFEPDKWGIPRFSFHQHNPFGIHDYIWYEFEQLSYTNTNADGPLINELLKNFLFK
jgi:hypothetical protein